MQLARAGQLLAGTQRVLGLKILGWAVDETCVISPHETQGLLRSRFRQFRERARASQLEIAAAMHRQGFEWSRGTVADFETGRRRLTVDELLGLCTVWEMPVAQLLPEARGLLVGLSGHAGGRAVLPPEHDGYGPRYRSRLAERLRDYDEADAQLRTSHERICLLVEADEGEQTRRGRPLSIIELEALVLATDDEKAEAAAILGEQTRILQRRQAEIRARQDELKTMRRASMNPET